MFDLLDFEKKMLYLLETTKPKNNECNFRN